MNVVPYILVGFPLFFGGMWCLVCFIISRVGGWGRLASVYEAIEVPGGEVFRGESGMLGVVNYNRVLTVVIGDEGIYLSVWKIFAIGHRPLFLPFRDIGGVKKRKVWFRNLVCFEVGNPVEGKVTLREEVFRVLAVRLNEE